LTRRTLFNSKLPQSVGTPCKQKSNEYCVRSEVLPTPVTPVKIVNSPGRKPRNSLFTFGNHLLVIPDISFGFCSSTKIETVLDTMEYACYVYDVGHVVLDNLQFILGNLMGGRFDKFEKQDTAIEKFRRFASMKNIHITLVIHPRKQDDDQPLNNSSVFGSAKATQEADTVIIIQKNGKKDRLRYLEVTKNRFSGDLGKIPLEFDNKTQRFRELTGQEAFKLGLMAGTEIDDVAVGDFMTE